MTLKEYLEDYASEQTRQRGEQVIRREVEKIPNVRVRQIAKEYLHQLHNGKRGFRFELQSVHCNQAEKENEKGKGDAYHDAQ